MSDLHIEFEGETFGLHDHVAQMPLLRFGHLARQGKDANEMESLDAIYEVLCSVIVDQDWERFQRAATRARTDGDELVEFMAAAISKIAKRPTSEPSDSSDGSPITSDSSADGSSLPVVARLEREGRPDLALIVKQAERFRASA